MTWILPLPLRPRETKKGMQHMDGQQVLDYCRWRKGGRGDVDRVDRQQRMLFKIFETMLATNQVKNIPDIYAAVQENIDTNLSTLRLRRWPILPRILRWIRFSATPFPARGSVSVRPRITSSTRTRKMGDGQGDLRH